MKLLSIAVLIFGLSQACFAGVYKLTFRRVAPVNDQKRCETFSTETAKEFSRQSGAQVIDFGCEKDEYTAVGWDAVITYQSEKPFEITSTHTSSPYGAALYTNLNDCNQRLATQEDFFTKTTGLEVLTSYCMLDIGSRWFESRIDALGSSELQPGVAAVSLWGTVPDANAIATSYQAAASAYGITVFEGGMNGGGGSKHLVVRYYASAPYGLNDYSDMKFDSVGSCESAAATTKTILQSTDKPVVIFCENRSGGFATLHATFFSDILKPVNIFWVNTLSQRYPTMSACQEAVRNLPSIPEAFGGVCSGVAKEFRIHLFSRP